MVCPALCFLGVRTLGIKFLAHEIWKANVLTMMPYFQIKAWEGGLHFSLGVQNDVVE